MNRLLYLYGSTTAFNNIVYWRLTICLVYVYFVAVVYSLEQGNNIVIGTIVCSVRASRYIDRMCCNTVTTDRLLVLIP
jgi:hypothetical protein